jgi:23S rRNA (cytosine1962-C5)-methyltransferase
MPKLTLKPGHVQPVWAGHPWVYAQAIHRIEGGAVAGDEVEVVDPRGNFIGRGFYSPGSAIPVRIVVRDRTTALDTGFFRARIQRAVERRRLFGLPSRETNALRMVNADGDDLPGLVVDVFADVAVVQIGTVGMKRREALLFEAIGDVLAPRAIVDRTSPTTARTEKFPPVEQAIVRGDTDVVALSFQERGIAYELPLSLAQKTGFYLDQRPMRGRVEQLSKGRRVLDAYSFVGSFAMAAARGGATEVVAVDESAIALEVGAECARRNGLIDRIRYVRDDARQRMTLAGSEGGFDLVLCDPPKFAPTKSSKSGALGAYQKLAAAACRATRPGGLLLFASCSAAVGLDALTRALAVGAREANLRATVLERFFQGFDHPVPASFPEGLYLKSVLCSVDPA